MYVCLVTELRPFEITGASIMEFPGFSIYEKEANIRCPKLKPSETSLNSPFPILDIVSTRH